MNKEIPFTGFTSVPSDYECQDGTLAQSYNLINENGAIKSILAPKVLINLGENYKVIHFHKTSSYSHYIIQNTSDNKLYWIDSTATAVDTNNSMGSYYNLSHVDSIGNTLLVFTDSAINYMLWKGGKYVVLGNKLPEATFSFGLLGHPRLYSLVKENDSDKKRGTFTINFNGIGKGDLFNTFSDENKTKITAQVMAKVNKFLAEQTIEKGRFSFPFFIRWAYRLYDGSHMMHSAPILMTPSTTAAPIVIWKRARGKDSYTSAELDIMMVAADITYSLTQQGNYYDLNDWQDIITGIDIYISKPIYTYDQEGEVTSFNDDNNLDCQFVGRLYNGEKDMTTPDTTLATDVTEDRMLSPLASTDFMAKYMEWTYSQIYALYFSKDRTAPNTTLHLPEFSDDKRNEGIEGNMNFYKLASLDIKTLKAGERKVIPVKDDYLQSLSSREVMTDDYLTHDRLMASSSFGFNSRLNLSGVKRELFGGFIAYGMFPYCQCVHGFSVDPSTKSVTIKTDDWVASVEISVYIRENGDIYRVSESPYYMLPYLRPFVDTNNWTSTTLLSDDSKRVTEYNFGAGTKKTTLYDSSGNVISTETLSNRYQPTSWGSWLFYPNANAFKIVITELAGVTFVADLKPHDFLNGAYAFLGFKSERPNPKLVSYTLPTVTQYQNIVDMPNKVYTSQVNNPFFFPVTGINTVGTGRILGISTAAKALSQGQFGQFPLYAFTTDGVWALETNSSGGYSAKQPITRDVCISADSITQIDSSVLFATDRGIMEIAGSTAQCITDIINGDDFFALDRLPGLATLYPDGIPQIDCTFSEYRKGARMTYDYINQRIILFNNTKGYAYVFSMRSKMWGIMASTLTSAINSYPEAYAMETVQTTKVVDDKSTVVKENCLVDLSRSEATHAKGLLVTRPLKMDAASVLKTFDTVFLRGLFTKGNVQTILYGSRDNINWHLVHSAKEHYLRGFRGSPYKYYRIAAITDLAIGETLVGASVQFSLRLTNQIR